jgi:hypothetical protein
MLALFPIRNLLYLTEGEKSSVPPATVPDSTSASREGSVVDFMIGTFLNAVSISVVPDGSIFVLDEGNNHLMEFAADGSLVKDIGGRGWGDLEFDSPTDVSAGFALNVYVADYNNRRIQRFDRKMNFVQSITADNIVPPLAGSFYPRAVALSAQGELFVVESDGRRVLKFDPAQHVEREFGGFNAGAGALVNPRDIAVTPDGRVIVLDQQRIVEYDTYANFLSSFQLDSLSVPTSLSLTRNGVIVVGPNKIVAYSLEGEKKYEIGEHSLIGSVGQQEFRDAGVFGSVLYILTRHSVIVTKVTSQ